LQVRRGGVRLFTRRGYDRSARCPASAVTAVRLRAKSFTIDGGSAHCRKVELVARRRAPQAHALESMVRLEVRKAHLNLLALVA
jgi:ATP-dependent DNA ligase